MFKYYVGMGFIAVIFLAVIVGGFFEAGGPLKAKDQQFDQKRVSDISSLRYSIESFYRKNNKLPEKLGDLSLSSYNSSTTNDPETDNEYEYSTTGTTTYKICATFAIDSKEGNDRYSYFDNKFIHPEGYHCFNLEIPKTLIDSSRRVEYKVTLVSPISGSSVNSPVTFRAKTTGSTETKLKTVFEKWDGKSWENLGETEYSAAGEEQSVTLEVSKGSFFWRAKACDVSGICGSWTVNWRVSVNSTTT